MEKKSCGHEEVCVECTKAEIATLEKKIAILRARIPREIITDTNYHDQQKLLPLNPYLMNGVANSNWCTQSPMKDIGIWN